MPDMTTGWADAAALRRDLDVARGRIAALEQELSAARRSDPPRVTESAAHDVAAVMATIASETARLLAGLPADSEQRRRAEAISRATCWGERLARELLAADRPARASVPEQAATRRSVAAGPAVLVMVAEPGVRELIVDILDVHGFRTLLASDAVAAQRLSAAHAGPLPLLIVDAGQGPDVARRVGVVRRAHREARELYLVARPFPLDALVAKVREFCRDVPGEPTGSAGDAGSPAGPAAGRSPLA
jgi:hypothetical protein